MQDATLIVEKPSLLVSAVSMLDELPLTQGDTKGDLYEYLLGKLTTAGINGQFRTPRHIIHLPPAPIKCHTRLGAGIWSDRGSGELSSGSGHSP